MVFSFAPFASLNDPPCCYGCLRLLNWLTELQMDKVDKFLYLYLILLEKWCHNFCCGRKCWVSGIFYWINFLFFSNFVGSFCDKWFPYLIWILWDLLVLSVHFGEPFFEVGFEFVNKFMFGLCVSSGLFFNGWWACLFRSCFQILYGLLH